MMIMGIDAIWFWVILGAIFFVVEFFTRYFVLVFFGVAALILALLEFLALRGIPISVTLFLSLGLLGTVLWRKRLGEKFPQFKRKLPGKMENFGR